MANDDGAARSRRRGCTFAALLLALLLVLAACGNGSDGSDGAGGDPGGDDPADGDAEEDYSDHFAGQTITLVTGTAGSGTDTVTRLRARHLGNFLPGNPDVTVENIDGAGGLVALNDLWRRPGDGYSLFGSIQTQQFAQLFDDPAVEYDLTEASWIGTEMFSPRALYIAGHTGWSNIEEVLAGADRTLQFGSQGPTHTSTLMAEALAFATDLEIDVVIGYSAAADIHLDIVREVLDGRAAAHTTILSTDPELIDDGTIIPILQFASERWDGLPDVPTIYEVIDEEDRLVVIRGLDGMMGMDRGMFGPPGIPEPVLQMLRDAHLAMWESEEYREEAASLGFDIAPAYRPGEELHGLLVESFGNEDVREALLQLVGE